MVDVIAGLLLVAMIAYILRGPSGGGGPVRIVESKAALNGWKRVFHVHWYNVAPGFENAVYFHGICRCGKRKASTARVRGYSAIDRHWVETGEKLKPIPPSAPRPSGLPPKRA